MYVDIDVPFGELVEVFLDGVFQPYCIGADDEQGWVSLLEPNAADQRRKDGSVRFRFALDGVHTEAEMRGAILAHHRALMPSLITLNQKF